MENLEIGKLHTLEQHRDAVHMAIAPAVAGERMRPGMHVGFRDGKAYNSIAEFIGIVDPFLGGRGVNKGDKFWIFLYPGSITSLRHEWTHPAFQDNPVAEPEFTQAHKDTAERVAKRLQGITPSEEWMKEYAERLNVSYEELISRAESYVERGSYWTDGGKFEGESLPNGFWEHFEKITGKESGGGGDFFSCSCQ